MVSSSLVEYVTGSGVRDEVLRAIEAGRRTTDGVLTSVDASDSAVYNALNDLAERGLVEDDQEQGWRVTGSGQVVTDFIGHRDRAETLLGADEAYWRDHDASVLPRRFRVMLSALAESEVVRASETDPHRVVRTVSEYLEGATDPAIISPIYMDQYADTLAGASGTRLLLDSALLTQDLDGPAVDPPATDHLDIRVCDVDFALTVTDEAVLLSLPFLDGGYDSSSEIICGDPVAIQWGSDLFEYCWEGARALEDVEV